jgi:phosphatidylserine/phosphatidylglycerophosphate/cardiolipin synthase-like enzyme
MNVPFPGLGSYPVRDGNLLRPLVDGGPAYRRICETVRTAQFSVWLTVTFFAQDFQMPEGQGSLFDVLDRAVDRGLDVRAIFWRPNPESIGYRRRAMTDPDDPRPAIPADIVFAEIDAMLAAPRPPAAEWLPPASPEPR